MCEASPPSQHPPRGPCGTLAEAERVVAAARIAALRARLGTDDDGGNAIDGSSSSPPLTSSSSPSAPPPPPLLLARVHPSVPLFVGGVASARCLRTLRANGVTHVVNATTCLPHFHEGRALVEGGEGEKGGGKKRSTAAAKDASSTSSSSPSSSPSPSPSSSFSYLRVPIYDDASQDLGPHLESVLAFIDAGLSFSRGGRGGGGGRRERHHQYRRHRRQEDEDDDDHGGDSDEDLDLDFDLDLDSSPPSSSSPPPPSPHALSGGGVLIHCVGGVSRSVALAAAWLVSRAGATAEGAVAAVRRARPLAAPNSGFVEQLCGLEARVAAARASLTRHHHHPCGGRESDREFSRRLAALLLAQQQQQQPSGSVVVTITTTTSAAAGMSAPRPISAGKRRSRSTLALSLLPSPVEEAGVDSDASAKSTVAVVGVNSAAADDDSGAPPPPPPKAGAKKKMPRATSALLRPPPGLHHHHS